MPPSCSSRSVFGGAGGPSARSGRCAHSGRHHCARPHPRRSRRSTPLFHPQERITGDFQHGSSPHPLSATQLSPAQEQVPTALKSGTHQAYWQHCHRGARSSSRAGQGPADYGSVAPGRDRMAAVYMLRAESDVFGPGPRMRSAAELPSDVLVCRHAADLLGRNSLPLLDRRTSPADGDAQTAFQRWPTAHRRRRRRFRSKNRINAGGSSAAHPVVR